MIIPLIAPSHLIEDQRQLPNTDQENLERQESIFLFLLFQVSHALQSNKRLVEDSHLNMVALLQS
jgi:hypothetical protein